MWLQGITTKPPSDAQVEVAIAALLAVREGDENVAVATADIDENETGGDDAR